MKRIRQKMIIFDLDGTLIDTAPDLIDSAHKVMKDIIVKKIDYNISKKFIGKGGKFFIKEHLSYNKIKLPQSEVNLLIKKFLSIYEKNISVKSKPYDGAVEMLNELRDQNIIMNICTNKPEKLARLILNNFNLSQYFTNIIGGDTMAQCKPNPLPLLKLMSDSNIKPHNTIMIGDTTTDLNAAKNAGIIAILVDFGYLDVSIADLKYNHIASNYSDIKKIIQELFNLN